MTRVRETVFVSGGRPLSHTRKEICRTFPTGKLLLMWQFCSPTLTNSCPASAKSCVNTWLVLNALIGFKR